MVGTFFRDSKDIGGDTSCTGSAVRSKGKDLVLTAGHCANGLVRATHSIFVPQYRHGKSATEQPAGVFPIGAIYRDPRYPKNETAKGPLSDLDFAFVKVHANGKGLPENITGALTFTATSAYEHNVTVGGYPSSASVNSKHQAITCDVPTTRLPGFRQLKMECGGYYGGVSGSPWIKGYNAAARTGRVVGNIGAGTLGQEYKLKDPNSTWKDATLLTSGQFSGNQKWDLVVRWSSGALNNYVGTTTGGLGAEQPVHGPNKTWTHSVVMTTGQFTSDGLTNDLIIRWSDGETTLHQDTRMNSLGTERMIAPPA